jgi:choline transport protein
MSLLRRRVLPRTRGICIVWERLKNYEYGHNKSCEIRLGIANCLRAAKFPVCFHFWVFHDSYGNMGNSIGVSWWHSNFPGVYKELTKGRTSIIALLNGGTAGFIWMYLIAWAGFMCVNTSMAEMGSMFVPSNMDTSVLVLHTDPLLHRAPTSGGQYHWVSEFAPPQHQKFISFIIGWLCVLGWQTGAANTAFLAGTQIQGLIVLNYPGYVFQRWHGTLLTCAVASFSVFFNTFLAKKLPLVEGIVLIIHVFGFFAVVVTLWVLGPRGDAAEVFTTFTNFGGWNSNATSALVGILAVMIPLLGADAAVHMSEELKDASKQIPRTMIWTTFINGALGFVLIVTFCMTLGDVNSVIDTPTGQPYIQVFFNATQSYAGATVLSALVIFMAMFCNLSIVATASRQLFAFARDQGAPFASWLAYVRILLPLFPNT